MNVMNARTLLGAFACGVGFGAGLAVSGLTRPEVVIGFLDVTGQWDPTLAVVMMVALAVNVAAVTLATRRRRPLWAPAFVLPAPRRIDRRLLVGAAIFGIGWALVGACPGPALTSLATGDASVFTFVGAMTAGLVLVDVAARYARRQQQERSAS